MSNEFVMVPRELVARIARAGCWPNDAEELRAVLAEQHQGEPVALPERMAESVSFYPTGWNACLDEIAKLGPLYTHADPGEVERLRAVVNRCRNRVSKVIIDKLKLRLERDTMRAQLADAQRAVEQLLQARDIARDQLHRKGIQLAERDALLRDFCAHSALICGDLLRLAREEDCATTDPIRARAYSAMDHSRKVKKALSASAEPSAPKCNYCGDTGKIMVGRSGDANDGNAPILEACEDCDRGAPVERDEREQRHEN